MIVKSTLVGAAAIALALTSFDMRPVAAAPEGGPTIAKQKVNTDEVSAVRKRRRGYRGNPGVPLAAFGAIAGTIAGIAAANSQPRYYHAPGYYYDDEPVYGYYGGPAYGYHAPRGYQQAPVYQHRDYYSRWGGSGGQPGYHGPNVNVPGATNYGQAAGQNGQAPPVVPNAAIP